MQAGFLSGTRILKIGNLCLSVLTLGLSWGALGATRKEVRLVN